LLVLDNHILCGSTDGYIYFDNPNFNAPDLTLRLHNGLIFDVIRTANRSNGHLVTTLGGDNSLKIWNVTKHNYLEDRETLNFDEMHKVEQACVITSAVPFPHEPTIGYTYDKYLNIFDYGTGKVLNRFETKGPTMKAAYLTDRCIATASAKYICFVDIRNRANTNNFSFKDDVRTLIPLGEYQVFYGQSDGLVGVVDRRKDRSSWRNPHNHCKIYDIAQMGDKILSCDMAGQIVSWNLKE
jgi:WD40 repeat protein